MLFLEQCGFERLVEDGISQTLSTPNYPSDYYPNLNCTWIFRLAYKKNRQLILTIPDFNSEPCCDVLEVIQLKSFFLNKRITCK